MKGKKRVGCSVRVKWSKEEESKSNGFSCSVRVVHAQFAQVQSSGESPGYGSNGVIRVHRRLKVMTVTRWVH